MEQCRHLRSHRSPNACRNRGSHRRAEQALRFPCSADEDDDWETDPDYVHDASRQCEEQRVSTASIISDLSRSIRDCSLRKSGPHHQEYADHQSQLHSYKGSAWTPANDPRGRQAPLCPQVRSSPSLGIERSSVFNRNAAETLDTFFSEKAKAWAGDAAQLSDGYENMESPQEPAGHSRCRRGTETGCPGIERTSRRPNHSRSVPARGVVVQHACRPGDNYAPDTYYDQSLRQLRHDPMSSGEIPGGQQRSQEGRRPSSAVSSSARILPQCRISHVQSCVACQEFNLELPADKEALYEASWPPLPEEDPDRVRVAHRKGRLGSSSQRQFSKVQQWLEQTPVDTSPGHPRAEKHVATGLASPDAPGRYALYGSLEPKDGDPWGRAQDAGDRWSLENPAEPRHRRTAHKTRRSPGHQPTAGTLLGEDTRTSPAACSCLFCERQKGRAKSVPGKQGERKKGTDPSAQEVAVQLQAENRVPRIVEAFERQSQREAKRAERDRTRRQASRHRDPEKTARVAKSRRDSKRSHPPQSDPKARKSHSSREEQEEEEPRPQAGPEGHPRHRQRKREVVEKRPSFMDRLRGLN